MPGKRRLVIAILAMTLSFFKMALAHDAQKLQAALESLTPAILPDWEQGRVRNES